MPRLRLTLAFVCAFVAVAQGCNACSEECRDPRQVGAGCQCSSDQDCTKPGQILLCEEGVCTQGDPADAPAKACSTDGDCKDGEKCGFKRCQPGPSCQRIDVSPLQGFTNDGNSGDVTITRDSASDCAHTIAFDTVSFTATIPVTGTPTIAGDCDQGVWVAALRAGAFVCGPNGTLVVADGVPCFTNGPACADTETSCTAIPNDFDATAGVCR